MAEAVSLQLKQIFGDLKGVNQLLTRNARDKRISESFDSLKNHLKEMMLGYENDEVQDLLEQLEGPLFQGKLFRIRRFRENLITMEKMLDICEKLCNIRYNSNIEGEEVVVGFDDEVETLLDQLTATSTKQFQVFAIAGMAGLGKTTLAGKLYRDPLIEYMFDIRAWTCVSQVYLKRDLLLSLLSSFISDFKDEIYILSDEQLGEKLYRQLKGQKYLVVLDDIWDCKAWNDLKIYFPDDKNGSRVLFTSRDVDVSLHAGVTRPAHVLRLRTAEESWDIFQKKLFRTGICPSQLEEHGKVINKKCEGLPLAIVIAAGLLKNNRSNEWWRQIADSLSSFMLSNPGQYMDTLALSYNHLPPHLKPCFLFLGVFPEDYDIPATKLICLWIAQGFIHESGSRVLEDIAEDFMIDLIKRSLLMTSLIRADSRVKTCRIHDLMRDLSLRKAEEEYFLPNINRYGKVASMLCSPLEVGRVLQEGSSILSGSYEFLRVLDVESIPISLFPVDAIQLVNLRYLAIQALDGSPQASISNLVNLQTLIISSRKNIVIPKSIWDMVNLRHLYIRSGENIIEEPFFVQVTENDGCFNGLASLQTLSQVCPQSCQNIFPRTPNLRKLGFCGPFLNFQILALCVTFKS